MMAPADKNRRCDRERLAKVQLAILIGSGILAWFIAPTINSPRQHAGFVDFYATCAGVIAALLIALVIEARSVVGSPLHAMVTAVSVGIGMLSALAALSPALPEPWIYRWLFVFMVAGGLGALVAAVHAGQRLIREDIHASQDQMLDAFAARRRADEEQLARQRKQDQG